jgi:hypothetical protein
MKRDGAAGFFQFTAGDFAVREWFGDFCQLFTGECRIAFEPEAADK